MQFNATLDMRELKKFDSLAVNLQKKVIKEANTAASKILLDAVVPNVPTEAGILKRSMGIKQRIYRSGTMIACIGARSQYVAWSTGGTRTISFFKILNNRKARIQKPHKYSHLVHNGTRAHQIVTRFGGRLIYSRGRFARSERNFRKPSRNFIIVNHPGARPNPFIARGYRSSESRAMAAWQSTASVAIVRECK